MNIKNATAPDSVPACKVLHALVSSDASCFHASVRPLAAAMLSLSHQQRVDEAYTACQSGLVVNPNGKPKFIRPEEYGAAWARHTRTQQANAARNTDFNRMNRCFGD